MAKQLVRLRVADARPPKRPAVFSEIADEIKQGDNWYAVAWKTGALTGGMYDGELLIRLAKSSDGRLVCTGMVLGGGAGSETEITARSLRDVPLAPLLAGLGQWRENRDQTGIFGAGFKRYAPKLRRGPRGLPDEHFKKIADLYRIALNRQPRAPLMVMRELLAKDRGGYVPSDSTIHGWVRQARQRGFLGKAVIGKAGEKPKGKS
jgi:hypothetical protein